MWATALSVGIPDELFWTLAPPEIYAAIEVYNAQQRREDMRAGLIAATIINVNRSKGSSLVQPSDFFPVAPSAEDYMSVEEAEISLIAWAAETNASFAENGGGGT